MKKDILAEIIEIEKDIQKKLDVETLKSKEWLEKVRREAEDEIAGKEESLRDVFNRAMEDARVDAEKRASEIISSAIADAERLRTIGDESLKMILSKYLFRILPG